MRFVIKNMSKPYTSLKSILAEFLPLNRTLSSDDMDETLSIIGSHMPDAANYTIENYAPLTDVWTWNVPERYAVYEAYLETEDGKRIVDFKDNPVHSLKFLANSRIPKGIICNCSDTFHPGQCRRWRSVSICSESAKRRSG